MADLISASVHARRAVVLAPFFSLVGPSRPRDVAEALAKLMPVDILTTDFDHSRKARREPLQSEEFAQIIYMKTPPYKTNVGMNRLLSHIVFSLCASWYLVRNRRRYDTIYATAPLNLLLWTAFSCTGTAKKIMDVVDIWPDALPFSASTRRALAPIFVVWKWLFVSSARKADIVISGSNVFLQEAKRYTSKDTQTAQFYIGHDSLNYSVPKEPLFTLAYVGNLGHLYDFETLLDVLSEEDLIGRMQLFVIGVGDRQDWLLHELSRRDIPHRFYGVVLDRDRLGSILCSCHAGFNGYVRTNASFSYKATTYLAAGLPLVNSMRGDLQQLIDTYDLGENYEAGVREQLRGALLRLSRRDHDVMASSCRQFFEANLESSRVRGEIVRYLAKNLGFIVPEMDSAKDLAHV